MIQTGIQDVVFLGIAVVFLVTIEARLRRRSLLAGAPRAAQRRPPHRQAPAREMLSVTSKLAALYAQVSTDALVLAGGREIEDLVGSLSNKVWQKLMILDVLDGAAAG